MITLGELRKHLHYEPATGKWTRLSACRGHRAGSAVGTIRADKEGRLYNFAAFRGIRYKLSRLAFFYMTGAWPRCLMDHKNGNTLDDAWENLREATYQQNSWNRGDNADNKSGHKGVVWHKGNKRWMAYIRVDGRTLFLGNFTEITRAADAYKAAAKKHFGEFARA